MALGSAPTCYESSWTRIYVYDLSDHDEWSGRCLQPSAHKSALKMVRSVVEGLVVVVFPDVSSTRPSVLQHTQDGFSAAFPGLVLVHII